MILEQRIGKYKINYLFVPLSLNNMNVDHRVWKGTHLKWKEYQITHLFIMSDRRGEVLSVFVSKYGTNISRGWNSTYFIQKMLCSVVKTGRKSEIDEVR